MQDIGFVYISSPYVSLRLPLVTADRHARFVFGLSARERDGNHAPLGNLSNLSSRREMRGKTKTVFADFAAHDEPITQKTRKMALFLNGIVDQFQIRLAPGPFNFKGDLTWHSHSSA